MVMQVALWIEYTNLPLTIAGCSDSSSLKSDQEVQWEVESGKTSDENDN